MATTIALKEVKKMALYQQELTLGIKTPEMIAEEEGIDTAQLKQSKADQAVEDQKNNPMPENSGFPEKKPTDKKDKKLKAFKYKKGDSVKIMMDNPGFTGLVGHIEQIKTNKNNEFVYKVRFKDKSFIRVFDEEFKCVDEYSLIDELTIEGI